MAYDFEDIEKVVNFKTWNKKQKVDELLRIDAEMHMELGIDSTKKEIADTEKRSRKIYKEISKLDPITGSLFLRAMLEE